MDSTQFNVSPAEPVITDFSAMTSQEMIVATLNTFVGEGNVCEIRCLRVEGRKRTDTGYFDDFSKAAKAVVPYLNNGTESVYFVLNQIKPELLARAANRIKPHLDTTASDKDVTERRWLFIDLDPVRSAKISSTDDQVRLSQERAADIADWLMQQGFAEPVSSLSGNGSHLLFPIQLPNNDESRDLVKNVIGALDKMFGDANLDIDDAVFNASRICKLYGTFARKGDSIPERPHRMARLTYVPDYLAGGWNGEVCSLDALRQVAAMFIDPGKANESKGSAKHSGRTTQFSVAEYLNNAGLSYREKQGSKGWTKFILSECPFDSSHKSPDSYVGQHEGGALTFFCSHKSCLGNRWEAFKDRHGDPFKKDVSRNFVGETPVSPMSQRVSPTKPEPFKLKSLVSSPFPIDCLPSRLSSFVQSVSRAVGCDHSFAALPALAVVSTAIGNSRRVSTKPGNYQPLIVWPVVIGLSGSQKSEPFDMATEPLNDIESTYDDEFRHVTAKYKAAVEHYKLDLKDWRASGNGDPPLEPEIPSAKRIVVNDTTSEGLIKIHASNPRGLLCCNEELSGWFGSFERYSGKGAVSGEQAKFLEFYDGKRVTSDRATVLCRVIPRSFVNVTGTIQPAIIQQALTAESRSNGLAARLWLTYPPSVPIRWRDEYVSKRTKQSYADLIRDLLSLSGATDSTGNERPALLELSTESRRMFAEFMNSTGEQGFVMFGDIRAAWAKFIGRAARLAGIIHCGRQADGDIKDPWTIDTDSMRAAITLCEWSKSETLRVYELLKEDAFTNSLRLMAAWIEHHGGTVTARDLCKHKRDIESSDDAEQWLRDLQDAGFGTYEVQPVGPNGGRPTAKFILKNETL